MPPSNNSMRVLWLTNNPMPPVLKRMGRSLQGSGYWMEALLDRLRQSAEVELAVGCLYPGSPDMDFTEDGVRYLAAPVPRTAPTRSREVTDAVTRARALCEQAGPDLVHVHGSERPYGLVAAPPGIACPVVLSLQGILNLLWRKNLGGLTPRELLGCHTAAEVLRRTGPLWSYFKYRKRVELEARVLRATRHFLGRTDWDCAHSLDFSPRARYFHVSELLRQEFHAAEWDRQAADSRTIVATNCSSPLRGTHDLIRAVAHLKPRFPDLRLRLAGRFHPRSGYTRFLKRLIRDSELSENVEILGYLDAATLAEVLRTAHVFVIASHMENSPNSLCEAQLVGVPCVASYVGGIPSLVKEGQTGLFFQAGDSVLLATRIAKVFEDDELAGRLSATARHVARQRHDPECVLEQLLAAYRDVLKAERSVPGTE